MARRLHGLALLFGASVAPEELAFQFFGRDVEAILRLALLHDGVEQGWLLEEVVVRERIEFEELHAVQAELHIDGGQTEKRLLSLVEQQLDAEVLHRVELLASDLLQEEFRVGLHLSRLSQRPGAALCHQVGEVDIVVGVVDKVGLKARRTEVLLVHWYEGEADRRFVAAASLLRLRLEVDGGIVGRQVLGRHRLRILTLGPRLGVVRALVETLAQAALVLLRLFLGAVALLHLHHSLRAVVLVAYDHDLVDGHGNLETVLVLD